MSLAQSKQKAGQGAFKWSALSTAMFLALVAGQAQADNHSSTIALNKSETQLLNINQDSHSVTVFKVNLGANNANALKKLAEIQVGFEPQCVTIKPDDSEAYVTTADGNVSVISLAEGDGVGA